MFLLCVQTEMELDVGVGRGYRYYTGVPVFEFGKCISSHTLIYSPVALYFALDSRPT